MPRSIARNGVNDVSNFIGGRRQNERLVRIAMTIGRIGTGSRSSQDKDGAKPAWRKKRG